MYKCLLLNKLILSSLYHLSPHSALSIKFTVFKILPYKDSFDWEAPSYLSYTSYLGDRDKPAQLREVPRDGTCRPAMLKHKYQDILKGFFSVSSAYTFIGLSPPLYKQAKI